MIDDGLCSALGHSSGSRVIRRLTVLILLLALGLAQISLAQAPTPLPLGLDNNYMVTGDYVVGGWAKTGSSTLASAKFDWDFLESMEADSRPRG
jgi:hypothetical protein